MDKDYLSKISIQELVLLLCELKKYPEDKSDAAEVLEEIKRRPLLRGNNA